MRFSQLILSSWIGLFVSCAFGAGEQVLVRLNQAGYQVSDIKTAVAFSSAPLPHSFAALRSDSREVALEARVTPLRAGSWGKYRYHAELDFTQLSNAGQYTLRIGERTSAQFSISARSYIPDQLLEFMRQQRCGENPWLQVECHQNDGRTAYGPLPAGTAIDARGGWHDAADLLKYHLTSGNATAQMLLAYHLGSRETAGTFEDHFDSRGREQPDGVADVLDEARWGLEWMLKMHPVPEQLYHQVADDRDHIGWRLPQNEIADYGWGKGGARVVYFADGRSQGLAAYQSDSTGVANLTGRYAAAMGLAWQIWEKDPRNREFAARCLQAGKEVYELGRVKEGVQQGNSYRAPYRYEERTWADDMEWGAAELYRATGEARYLEDAKRYALLAADESWMGKEQTRHYEFYPFMNLGHYRLHGLVHRSMQKVLEGYYRKGIERCVRAAQKNPYRVGVPFIWCSNNLVVALATQCLLYEEMTGDHRYREFAAKQRDWLLGRNPWGFCMFTEIGTVYPQHTHLMTTQITKRTVRGGLVDGPVYERIFKSLKGVSITEPDPLAAFQGTAVYHDDVQDYSSNEPTMDGTASAVLLFALCSSRNL